MKHGLSFFLIVAASPVFAHHEVVVATSMMPLASALAVVPIAAFAAWRRGRKKR